MTINLSIFWSGILSTPGGLSRALIQNVEVKDAENAGALLDSLSTLMGHFPDGMDSKQVSNLSIRALHLGQLAAKRAVDPSSVPSGKVFQAVFSLGRLLETMDATQYKSAVRKARMPGSLRFAPVAVVKEDVARTLGKKDGFSMLKFIKDGYPRLYCLVYQEGPSAQNNVHGYVKRVNEIAIDYSAKDPEISAQAITCLIMGGTHPGHTAYFLKLLQGLLETHPRVFQRAHAEMEKNGSSLRTEELEKRKAAFFEALRRARPDLFHEV